ncbi:MAG: hypothetical protein Q8L60_16635 [Gammaproteobacteria bacterium]|nr:hypothetical protein [Gammaproteobacteria bacterium]MDP2141254.1 hypothetical protein [Gammaproteobacteria bacterium]MDP2349072.1 hypothetical protein [Gammaproteobacteria bacterium]
MSSSVHGALLLTSDLVDFVLGPISMKAGSCSRDLVPSISQAYGCRVSRSSNGAGVDEVCVFLSESRSANVLRDLRDGGAFSVVFSRPTTHRTVQLKAVAVRIEPLQPGDQALIDRYGLRASGELISLGYPPAFSQALMAPGITDAVCVCFVPNAAFDQTPGAGAGQPLGVTT